VQAPEDPLLPTEAVAQRLRQIVLEVAFGIARPRPRPRPRRDRDRGHPAIRNLHGIAIEDIGLFLPT
jgi:hypothetical protein